MKSKQCKLLITLMLTFAFFLFPKWSSAAPILNDELTTVFNSKTGEYKSGPKIPPQKNVVRLAYQGGKNLYRDIEIDGKPIASFPVIVPKNAKVKIRNVGLLYGDEVYFMLESEKGLHLDYDEGGLAVSSVESYDGPLQDGFNFWIEDEDGKIVNDEDTIFLLSSTSKLNEGIDFYETIFLNPNPEIYLFVGDDIDYLELSKQIYYESSTLELKTQSLYNSKSNPINYSYGFKSVGKPINVLRNQSATKFKRVTDIFLSTDRPVGVELPYKAPNIISNYNEDWPYAKVLVTQEVINQGFTMHYPTSLDITVDLDPVLDLNQISKQDISVMSSNGIPVTDYDITIAKSGVNKGRLVLSLPRATLKTLKDATITMTVDVPLNLSDNQLNKYLDNGVIKTPAKAKNNKTVDKFGQPIISTGTFSVKAPKPMGDAVVGKTVYQHSYSTDLVADELVTNLRSNYPNDNVVAVNVIENKQFSNTGMTDVTVLIKSTITGLTNEIKVSINVVTKGLDILEPVQIIPKENQVAVDTSSLIYFPKIVQKIKKPSDGSGTTMDNLVITVKHSAYIKCNEGDFKVSVGGVELDKSNYILKLDNNEFTVKFKNSTINNLLLGKEVVIEQKSPILLTDEGIMGIYNKNTKQFNFPITAYNSYTEINDTLVHTQNPQTKGNQIVNYKPVIIAQGIDDSEVALGSAVKSPQEYIKNISPLDFSFDSYEYSFKEQFDFSDAGEVNFVVIAKSQKFEHLVEIPIKVTVKQPKVEMRVTQVYKENDKKPIYYKIDPKREVDNNKIKLDASIGEPLEPILEELAKDESVFKLNYEWYKPLKIKDYTVIIDGKAVSTDIVPDKAFKVVYRYEGILKLTVPNLDYGDAKITSINHSLHSLIPSNEKNVEVINTTLNPEWRVTVIMTKDIENTVTHEKYAGGLEFTRTNEVTPVSINSKSTEVFAKRWSTNNELKTNIPLSVDLYQDIGNEIGSYSGNLLWNLENAL